MAVSSLWVCLKLSNFKGLGVDQSLVCIRISSLVYINIVDDDPPALKTIVISKLTWRGICKRYQGQARKLIWRGIWKRYRGQASKGTPVGFRPKAWEVIWWFLIRKKIMYFDQVLVVYAFCSTCVSQSWQQIATGFPSADTSQGRGFFERNTMPSGKRSSPT